LSFILFLFFTGTGRKLEKGFERLHIFDYFKAKEYFEESLESKTPGASLD